MKIKKVSQARLERIAKAKQARQEQRLVAALQRSGSDAASAIVEGIAVAAFKPAAMPERLKRGVLKAYPQPAKKSPRKYRPLPQVHQNYSRLRQHDGEGFRLEFKHHDIFANPPATAAPLPLETVKASFPVTVSTRGVERKTPMIVHAYTQRNAVVAAYKKFFRHFGMIWYSGRIFHKVQINLLHTLSRRKMNLWRYTFKVVSVGPKLKDLAA